jgi:hypothetical protein
MRADLPQVPACTPCNNRKSALELYAMAVLPFGATHPEATDVLSTMVPGRLEKNQRLARMLSEGMKLTHMSRDGGRSFQSEMSLPLDGERIQALLQMITRGLAFAEWGILLPDADCTLMADFMGEAGTPFINRMLALNGARVSRTLGNGIFSYEGLQGVDSPQLTVWRMSFSGVTVGGDRKSPTDRTSVIGAVSVPRSMSRATEVFQALLAEQDRIIRPRPGL